MSPDPCQEQQHDLDLAALALRAAMDNLEESSNLVLAGFVAVVVVASLGGPKAAAGGLIIWSGVVGKWASDDDDVLAAVEGAGAALDALYECLEQHEDDLPPSGEFLVVPFEE